MFPMLVSTPIGMVKAVGGYALLFSLLITTLAHGVDPSADLRTTVQWDASTSELDLTGAILQRNMNANVILQRAAVLLKDRLSDSGLLQDAAMDLLRICKSATDTEDPKQARDLEGKAKKIYGVRAAMIDMDSASVSVPRSCAVLLNPGQRAWFHASKASLTDAANLPSTRELDSCLKELFKVDNMWTSFTSHRQDANTLCEVPGTENASRMIVELLNDVNSIIPEWVQTFRFEQEAHAAQLEMRMSFLRQIHDMEQQRKDDIEQERHDVRKKMIEFERIWTAQIDKLATNANAKMSDLGGQVEQMRGDLEHYAGHFLVARNGHENLLAAYQATFFELLQQQKHGMTDIDLAIQSLLASSEQASNGIALQSDAASQLLKNAMRDVAARHAELAGGQLEFGTTQQVQLRRQRESLAFTEQLETKIADSIGEINMLLKRAEPVLKVVNAVVTRRVGTTFMLVSGCAAVSILLMSMGYIRYAVTIICLSVLGWAIRAVASEVFAKDLHVQWRVVPKGTHNPWLGLVFLLTFASTFVAVRHYRSRRCQRNGHRVVQENKMRLSRTTHESLRRKTEALPTSRRAQTVEPDMIGFY
ncbi:uncharacterized protein AB675_4074 [Cyphellophora attinorum]|uniref:Nuclear fusion protein KAR5 n=1 Tax=Cyphellophora attinorum TaxID=1664694 RepID=A0A0N0NHA8_9EURO|nr:uncharacterized protein AB675_4074 [Phialophora attinorum]KPI34471.1 hypothetical protein AB675_4074 [Phialophora attinorum]